MFSLSKKFSVSLIPLILISFAWVGIWGISLSMEMRNGQMSSCPFIVGQATICQMNAMEHITKWQQFFLAIPTKTSLLMLAIALLAVVIIPFVKPFLKLEGLNKFVARLFAYRMAHSVKVFDPFLLAFSDGILNPKIY